MPAPCANTLGSKVGDLRVVDFEPRVHVIAMRADIACFDTSNQFRRGPSLCIVLCEPEALANKVRTGLGEVLKRSEQDIGAAVAEIGKRMKGDVVLQGVTAVGLFDDRPDRIGILLTTTYTFNGAVIPVLSANTLVRVRGRILFAYMYTRNLEPEGVTEVASIARSWTDAIVAANGEGRPQPR